MERVRVTELGPAYERRRDDGGGAGPAPLCADGGAGPSYATADFTPSRNGPRLRLGRRAAGGAPAAANLPAAMRAALAVFRLLWTGGIHLLRRRRRRPARGSAVPLSLVFLAFAAAPVRMARGFSCTYTNGQLVRDLYVAYPQFIPPGSLSFLETALDNAAGFEIVSGDGTEEDPGNPTFFAPTDAAFEEFFLQTNTTFNELISSRSLGDSAKDRLGPLLSYQSVKSLKDNALFARAPVYGPLTTNFLVNGDRLQTAYVRQELYGPAGNVYTQDDRLEVEVDDTFEFRQFATIGLAAQSIATDGLNLRRQAILTAPNLLLCGGSVVVHIADTVQVPTIAYFPTIEELACASPQLSVTCEACTLLRKAFTDFIACTLPNFQTAIASTVGYCGFGEAFSGSQVSPPGGLGRTSMKTFFAPTNAAWSRFFLEFRVEKEILFANDNLDILRGLVGMSFVNNRYFGVEIFNEEEFGTNDIENGQFTGCAGAVPTLTAFVLCKPPPLDTLATIEVDGRNLDSISSNQCKNGLTSARVVATDIVACNGVIHPVDNVLVGPSFSVFSQLRLRPNYSFFVDLITSQAPGSDLAGSVSAIIREVYERVAGNSITVYAPTNAAINATLAYLGLDFAKDVLDPSTFEALELRRQLLFYTTMRNAVIASGALGSLRRFKEQDTCRLLDDELLTSFLLEFGRVPPCNYLSGTVAAELLRVSVQGLRGPLTKRIYVLGDVNAGLIVDPNNRASNGDLQGINSVLIPPRLAPSAFFRLQRTPVLSTFTSLAVALGLERELRQYTANVFAPTDGAFVRHFLAPDAVVVADGEDFGEPETAATVEAVLRQGLLPLAYDTLLYHTNFGVRPLTLNAEPLAKVPGQRLVDAVLYNNRTFSSVLASSSSVVTGDERTLTYGYINATTCHANLTVSREGSFRLPFTGGTVLSSLFLEGPMSTVGGIELGNTAGIVPPFSQNATNGAVNVLDKVLTPPLCDCAVAQFEYFGFGNGSGVAFTYDPYGAQRGFAGAADQPPRATAYPLCEALPCTYSVPNLVEPAATDQDLAPSSRLEVLSIEAIVTWRPSSPCEHFCPPLSGWWCLPCSERNTQSIVTINGCAPFQPACGGSLTLYVNDLGEVYLGIQDWVQFFTLRQGLRVVDPAVVARGFIAVPGQPFKILATYDDACGFAKIYINDVVRGVATFPGALLRGGGPIFSIRYFYFTSGLITVGCGTHENPPDVLEPPAAPLLAEDSGACDSGAHPRRGPPTRRSIGASVPT